MEELGPISVAKQVFAVIAKGCVEEVEGVIGLVDPKEGFLSKLIPGDELKRAVEVRMEEESVETPKVSLDVHIGVEYGNSIPQVAESVQKLVKERIEAMTNARVEQVNVHIVSLTFPPESEVEEDSIPERANQ